MHQPDAGDHTRGHQAEQVSEGERLRPGSVCNDVSTLKAGRQRLGRRYHADANANEALMEGLVGKRSVPLSHRLPHATPNRRPAPARPLFRSPLARRSLEVLLLTISNFFLFLTAPPAMYPRHNLPEDAMADPRWPFLAIA